MSPATTRHGIGSIPHIPLAYTSSDSHNSALALLLTLLPTWSLDVDYIEFIRFTDGITNTLLKAVNRGPGLSQEAIDRDAVLLRAYGNKTAILIDREQEAANHELLMQHGLAPELLARFDNGMLYRYIAGTPAQSQHLREPSISKAIARKLAEWHATVPCLQSIPSNSAPQTNGKIVNGNHKLDKPQRNDDISSEVTAVLDGPRPNLWATMQKWLLALPTDTEEQRARQTMLQQEFYEIVRTLGNRSGLGENGLVLAHGDLLCANIIMHRHGDDDDSTTVSFIDYEYATPSPAAFDLANHFAEWAGYDCDYMAMPTVSQRRTFIREYMRTYIDHADSGQDSPSLDFETEVQRLEDEVNVFRGLPGFYWGIWASIQATISEIDFDYATYSELRLSEYWACKEEESGQRKATGKEMPVREKTWWQQ